MFAFLVRRLALGAVVVFVVAVRWSESWGETPRFRKLYKGRAAVQREFGRLKNDWALAPLRVLGLDRVRLHADPTILAKLACALSRPRAVPLAA